jgi:hypothetical protein
MTRDFDAIQSTASVVSVAASALLLVHLNPTQTVIAFGGGAVLVTIILLVSFLVPAEDYAHHAKGPLTPLVALLLVLNFLGLVLVVALHSGCKAG